MASHPHLFVISGPSGAGKGTLISSVMRRHPSLTLAVSATTRHPRPEEIDGVSYHFLSEEEFSAHIEQGDFLEWAEVYKHRYGTLFSELEKSFQNDSSLVLELDVQGAMSVRKVYADAVLIFIEPPSMDVLIQRLHMRATEDASTIERRVAAAQHELSYASSYDVRIVNDDVERASQELYELILSYEGSRE